MVGSTKLGCTKFCFIGSSFFVTHPMIPRLFKSGIQIPGHVQFMILSMNVTRQGYCHRSHQVIVSVSPLCTALTTLLLPVNISRLPGVFQYDVRHIGEPGGGGEYEVQLGFGWTNGVILQLIDKYAETVILPAPPIPAFSQEAIVIVFASVLSVIAVGSIVCVVVTAVSCGQAFNV